EVGKPRLGSGKSKLGFGRSKPGFQKSKPEFGKPKLAFGESKLGFGKFKLGFRESNLVPKNAKKMSAHCSKHAVRSVIPIEPLIESGPRGQNTSGPPRHDRYAG